MFFLGWDLRQFLEHSNKESTTISLSLLSNHSYTSVLFSVANKDLVLIKQLKRRNPGVTPCTKTFLTALTITRPSLSGLLLSFQHVTIRALNRTVTLTIKSAPTRHLLTRADVKLHLGMSEKETKRSIPS